MLREGVSDWWPSSLGTRGSDTEGVGADAPRRVDWFILDHDVKDILHPRSRGSIRGIVIAFCLLLAVEQLNFS